MINGSTGINFKLSEADQIKIDFDKIKSESESNAEKIAHCKTGYDANQTLIEAMKNVDNEIELSICLPDYGAVLTASAKSEGLGKFAENSFSALINCAYKEKWL